MANTKTETKEAPEFFWPVNSESIEFQGLHNPVEITGNMFVYHTNGK